MDARRYLTALAVPCALIAAGSAAGQDRASYGPNDPRMRIVPRAKQDNLMPAVPEAQPRRANLNSIESWAVDDDMEISLGRFRVVDRARPWSRPERDRAPMQMDVDTRSIAGAGFRMRF